ncbi:hypothetical protein [Aeromicrobium sp.]|uniref:hypothetical protein n=1 Tax=Aeromicrobium sp. TaxID=1871063 RepID=UPI00262A01FA|nr:hypothetical protein [Aeromicrobium sp.]
MTARPVPRSAEPSVMYAVMTAEPLESEDLIPPPSPQLLRRYGTSDAAMRRLRSRRHQLLVMRRSSLDDAARTQLSTRVEALRRAEAHDGVVIDLMIPRVVEQRSDEVSLEHATQWYVVDYAGLEAGLLTTVGLTSFGLPEVEVEQVDQQGHAMFSAVLAGLVHRLIAEWPANDPVGTATITLRDIAYGLGDPGAAQTPGNRSVDVAIDHDADRQRLVVRLIGDPATTLFAP